MIPLKDDNPSRTTPYVTMGIIAMCALVFLWQLSFGESMQYTAYALGLTPAVLFGYQQLPPELVFVPAWVTAFSSMFLHGSWLHLLGNMLYLWIFGDNVEDAMGHGRFVVFYLVCGLVAVFSNALPDAQSVIPIIGASGAISGVLGAYLLLYPRARVLVVIPLGFFLYTMRLSAVWVLGLWFGVQLISSLLNSGGDGGGVAWLAHVGGFICGLLLIPVFKQRRVRLFAPARSRW